MSLQDAVDAIRKVEERYRSAALDREAAVKLMGFSGLNGNSAKALAALASYGLVERAGKGMMWVTPLGRDILHSDKEQDRLTHLRAAATEPRLFRDIRDRFPDHDVPPEDGVKSYLNRMSFNTSAVGPALRAFMTTAQYLAEQGESDGHSQGQDEGADVGAPDEAPSGGASVGDLVQWMSGGRCAPVWNAATGALGIEITPGALANKISRGGFSAAFLLQCARCAGRGNLRNHQIW